MAKTDLKDAQAVSEGAPIVIWGAGAIGAAIGAALVRSGRDVLLVDANREHVTAMRENGLRIEGPVENYACKVNAITPNEMIGEWPLILLAVKAHHTEKATKQLLPFLRHDGAVVSCQNGLNEPLIANVVGKDRVIGAFVNFLADYLEPGRILYGGRGAVVVGEVTNKKTQRIRELHEMLKVFDPDAVLTDDIFGYLWGKAAYGTLLKTSAIADASIVEYLTDPIYRRVMLAMIKEVLLVAHAEGIDPKPFNGFIPKAFLTNDSVKILTSIEALRSYNSVSTKTHSGVWRDLVKRKRQTDVAAQLNPIQKIASDHRIPTPLLDQLIKLVGEVESGRREVGLETFSALGEILA